MFSLRLQWLLTSHCDPVTSNLADPGVVDTELYRHAWWGLRAAQGALGWLLLKVRVSPFTLPSLPKMAAGQEGSVTL